jgi:intracellular multiplication protein IcmC
MYRKLLLMYVAMLPSVAHAALTELDVQDMLENAADILNPVMGLLLAISFVMGLVFILRGLMMLRAFSLPLTQATRPGELAGPLVYIFVGAVLVYIPTSTDILTATLFGQGGPSIFTGSGAAKLEQMGKASDQLMQYSSGGSVESHWATMLDTIVLYMQFIGFLAFMRGWILISHAGQPGTQQGTISKGVIHVVGGILAINFLPLVNVLVNTIVG